MLQPSTLQLQKNEAIAAAERQAKSGQQLQAEGWKTIRDIQGSENIEKKTNLLKAATATIKQGCDIEMGAMQKLIELRTNL